MIFLINHLIPLSQRSRLFISDFLGASAPGKPNKQSLQFSHARSGSTPRLSSKNKFNRLISVSSRESLAQPILQHWRLRFATYFLGIYSLVCHH